MSRGALFGVGFCVLAIGLVGCGPRTITVEQAWSELTASKPLTSVAGLERRLELTETVLKSGVDRSGRPLAVPLGLTEVMAALAIDERSESLREDFEKSLEGLGEWVSVVVEHDRASVQAGTRTVLRQTIELSSTMARNGIEERSAAKLLWVPRRVPGFVEQLRFDGKGAETSFELRVVDGEGLIASVQGRSFRAGGVGPSGTLFEVPDGSRRIELIYGRIEPGSGPRGLLMPVVSRVVRLPVWLGRTKSTLFSQVTPTLEVHAGPRAGVALTVPSVVVMAEEFSLDVQFTDAFGNPTRGLHSAFEVSLDHTVVSSFGSGKGSNLRIGNISVVAPGVARFRLVSSEGLVAWSNPVLVLSEPRGRLSWRDREAEEKAGEGIFSHAGLTAVWGFGEDPTELRDALGTGRAYATSGARILARCVEPKGPRSAHCLINGTAPISRVRILSRPTVANETVVLRDERPLAPSSADGLLAVRWGLQEPSQNGVGNGGVGLWRGSLSLSRGEFSSAVLHGIEVAREGGQRGVFGFEVIAGESSGILLQGEGMTSSHLRVRLIHQWSGGRAGEWDADGFADIDLRGLPHREETAWGFLEANWLKEDPILDLDLQWPELSAEQAKTAWVVVEQVDGQLATVRFADDLFGGLEPQ